MDIVKRYEELLKLDPGSIAFAPLAEELCYRGFWEGALKVCRQGLTHHPQHMRGRVLLGWALKELGETEEAHLVLEEVEAEIQKNALLFRLLADLAKKAGNPDRAERLLSIHQNLQPSTVDRTTAAPEAEASPAVVSSPEPLMTSSPEPAVEPLPVIPPEPSVGSMPEPSISSPQDEAADFLSSLLNRYEALPEKSATEQRVFTEDDRRTLSRILEGLRR